MRSGLMLTLLTGLWHTHHGVSELSSCGDQCIENAHELDDPKADLVGTHDRYKLSSNACS